MSGTVSDTFGLFVDVPIFLILSANQVGAAGSALSVTFTDTTEIGGVPEASSGAMMALGFGALGYAASRRGKTTTPMLPRKPFSVSFSDCERPPSWAASLFAWARVPLTRVSLFGVSPNWAAQPIKPLLSDRVVDKSTRMLEVVCSIKPFQTRFSVSARRGMASTPKGVRRVFGAWERT